MSKEQNILSKEKFKDITNRVTHLNMYERNLVMSMINNIQGTITFLIEAKKL